MINTTAEISAAQLAANQLNALKSTGPNTPEGKAVARFNARRHGMTGQFYCMSEEDERAYTAFETNLFGSLKPVGAYETQIAISITQDHWRLNRSRAVEFNLYGKGHDELGDLVDAPTENTHAAATMADTYQRENRVFANIALYETRIHRMIAKNEKRLAELQAERKSAEKLAREEAELLVRFADVAGVPLEEVGLVVSNGELRVGVVPVTGIRGSQSQADGFAFSIAEIRAKLKRDQMLADARECARLNWDPKIIARRLASQANQAA